MNSHQLINQNSNDTEKYTPAFIIELARELMGGIDIDPASSLIANETVKAKVIYTIKDDGLSRQWFGNVWMNHPFSKGERACSVPCKKKTCKKRGHCITKDIPGNQEWINKLVSEYNSGGINQAVCICFASTSERWFQPLHDFPQCYIYGRTDYRLPNGSIQKGVTKGSVITYMGSDIEYFYCLFSSIGSVKLPYNWGY